MFERSEKQFVALPVLQRTSRFFRVYRQFVFAFALEVLAIVRFLVFPKFDLVPRTQWVEIGVTLFMLTLILYFFVQAFVIVKTRNREPLFFLLLTTVALGLIANLILFFAKSYCAFGLLDQGKLTTDNVTCVYFSLITWTTVGFGDVTPTPATRMLAAAEALTGYLVMAAIVGLLVVTFNKLLTTEMKDR